MRHIALILLGVILAAAGLALWLWLAIAVPYRNFPAEGVFVTVPRGASCRTVGHLLQQEGVVRSALAFRLYCRQHPKRALQAGEYFFENSASGRDVFWKIANGKIFEKQFTVREGATLFDIARELEAEHIVSAATFLKAADDPAPIHELAPAAQSLEGFLFPATYNFPRNPGAEAVIAAMTGKFKDEWARIQRGLEAHPANPGAEPASAHDPPPRNLLAVVTLASLVERETRQKEERPLVAAVYENRLKKHMLLQCDPTVIYALEREDNYRGSLTLEDLRVDSPYNTYRYRGLPPGPIGNPGEASLRAALDPADSPYLYFVANTQGGHFFAQSLEEHNRNVRRYHRLLKGLPDEPEPPPAAAPATPAKKSRHAAGPKKRSVSAAHRRKKRVTP